MRGYRGKCENPHGHNYRVRVTVEGPRLDAIGLCNFSKDFAGFLLYIVVWLAPWFGILITDWLLRRRRYDPLALRSNRDGLYWRNGGIHWPAIIAQVVGMVAALMWINAAGDYPSYTGPISNHFPGLAGGDFSWALGIIVASLLYWVLAGRGVRREGEQTVRI